MLFICVLLLIFQFHHLLQCCCVPHITTASCSSSNFNLMYMRKYQSKANAHHGTLWNKNEIIFGDDNSNSNKNEICQLIILNTVQIYSTKILQNQSHSNSVVFVQKSIIGHYHNAYRFIHYYTQIYIPSSKPTQILFKIFFYPLFIVFSCILLYLFDSDHDKTGMIGMIMLFAILFRSGSADIVRQKLSPYNECYDTYSFSIYNQTALIGAACSNDMGTHSGSVHVFEFNFINERWTQTATLLPEEHSQWLYMKNLKFGSSVSLYEHYALIGTVEGSLMYVFEKQTNGSWLQISKTNAYNGRVSAICISNQYAVLGGGLGRAYVLERLETGVWVYNTTLQASDEELGDLFGTSVSIYNQSILIGASSHYPAGSAYIFELINGVWTQTNRLLPNTSTYDAQFGASVSVNDKYALIGAPSDGNSSFEKVGSAFIFEKLTNGQWVHNAKLFPNDLARLALFGISVSIFNNTALVGAKGTRDNVSSAYNVGSAYMFKLINGNWTQTNRIIPPDASNEEHFGANVFLYNGLSMIGANRAVYTMYEEPTKSPTKYPTILPTEAPSDISSNPTISPTLLTRNPTCSSKNPTKYPSISPTMTPTRSYIIENTIILKNDRIYLLFLLLLIPLIFYPIYQFKKYRQHLVVDKALILIIGISNFNNEELKLPGIKSNVTDLEKLWKSTYNYNVCICNAETLTCTKKNVIDFIDKYKEELIDVSYKAVLVHILSHGVQNDCFLTSDLKNMSTAFIEHELITTAEFANNFGLLKLIFHHACRGANDYFLNVNAIRSDNAKMNTTVATCCCFGYFHINFKTRHGDHNNQTQPLMRNENKEDIYDNSKKIEIISFEKDDDTHVPRKLRASSLEGTSECDPHSNCVTIYGNIEERALSDQGQFTNSICNVFHKNQTKWMKDDFQCLIREIGIELEKQTKKAQICTTKGVGTLRQPVCFVKCHKNQAK